MKVIGYQFAPGARFQSGAAVDAKIVGQHLEMLREKCKGELTPLDVVKDARHNNSPLHTFFEWNDGAAAERYRLSQARGLIRSVVAIYREPKQPQRKIRAFIHVPEAGAPHYRSVEHAMSQKKTRDLILRQAWREFTQWRSRYQDLKEFAALFEKADEVGLKLPAGVRS